MRNLGEGCETAACYSMSLNSHSPHSMSSVVCVLLNGFARLSLTFFTTVMYVIMYVFKYGVNLIEQRFPHCTDLSYTL